MSHVCASRSATISSVKAMILLVGNADLLHKGQLMANECTLGCYGLQTDDCIVAIERASGNGASSCPQLDSSCDELNLTIRRESYRIRDLLMRRREMKPRAHRKFVTAALRQLDQPAPRYFTASTVISGWIPGMGSSPLPVPW
jgi:hypothetical protein